MRVMLSQAQGSIKCTTLKRAFLHAVNIRASFSSDGHDFVRVDRIITSIAGGNSSTCTAKHPYPLPSLILVSGLFFTNRLQQGTSSVQSYIRD